MALVLAFMGALTSSQMVRALHHLEGQLLPVRTLASWTEKGIIPASIRPAGGRGVYRLYDRNDLARARAVVYLRKEMGLSIARVRLALAFIDERWPELLTEQGRKRGRIVVDRRSKRARVEFEGGPTIEASHDPGQIVLTMEHVMDGLDAAAMQAQREVAA